jgi:hypothetical protein
VVGQVVQVEVRTAPGMNKLGGIGRISSVNKRDRGEACTYNVKYVVEGRRECNVAACYIQDHAFEEQARIGEERGRAEEGEEEEEEEEVEEEEGAGEEVEVVGGGVGGVGGWGGGGGGGAGGGGGGGGGGLGGRKSKAQGQGCQGQEGVRPGENGCQWRS